MKAKQFDRSLSLLGERLVATHLSGKSSYSVSGECVYESKNMLYLRKDDQKIIKLPKSAYLFILQDGTTVNGKAL
ncbi:MAG: hypothetical protein QXX17_05670, partial [Conexivisphaerales archaeon]